MTELNVKFFFYNFDDSNKEGFRVAIKNFLKSLDCLPKDKLRSKLKEFFDELVPLKNRVDSLFDDFTELCDLAHSEGYFFVFVVISGRNHCPSEVKSIFQIPSFHKR